MKERHFLDWINFSNPCTTSFQQTLSMNPINISLQTLTISCDYLRCSVITIRLHWNSSDIKQICPLRFVSIGWKLAMLRLIVNYGNLKWFTGNYKYLRYVYTIYLSQICIGPTKKCLLGYYSTSMKIGRGNSIYLQSWK